MATEPRYITTREACILAMDAGIKPITQPTISGWAVKFGFGRKIGGRWRIDRQKFIEFLHGDEQWKTEPGTEPADEEQNQPSQQRRDW